jgi:uncharacterized protein (TIGR02118 family)
VIKTIVVAYRKPGLTVEEFNKHWKEVHAPLAAKMIPGLRRYVQNHFISVPGKEYEGDGIVEMWYDSLEAQRKSMEYLRSPAAKALAEDGASFADMRNAKEWIVEEHVIKDFDKK